MTTTKPDLDASGPKTLTDWYPADMKPVHVGVYETISPIFGEPGWFSKWDGKHWLSPYFGSAKTAGLNVRITSHQNRPWRGLTEQAK